jgi:hypothetical protein
VRGEHDLQLAIAGEMQVGMMIHRPSMRLDAPDEVHGGVESVEHVIAPDRLAVARELPTGKSLEPGESLSLLQWMTTRLDV